MSTENDNRIKPVIILPQGQVSRDDIERLNSNGLCVVEAQDPSLVRFMEPPPDGYGIRERAAISLFRRVMAHKSLSYSRSDIAVLYADILLEGSPLEPIIDVERVQKNRAK